MDAAVAASSSHIDANRVVVVDFDPLQIFIATGGVIHNLIEYDGTIMPARSRRGSSNSNVRQRKLPDGSLMLRLRPVPETLEAPTGETSSNILFILREGIQGSSPCPW